MSKAAVGLLVLAFVLFRIPLAVACIRLYQRFLQPKTGCIYETVCSEFGVSEIRSRGIYWGVISLADRVASCNDETRKEFHALHSCGGCSRAVDDSSAILVH